MFPKLCPKANYFKIHFLVFYDQIFLGNIVSSSLKESNMCTIMLKAMENFKTLKNKRNSNYFTLSFSSSF